MRLLLVGLGGFTGAVLRYLVAGWTQQATRSVSFPYGTLAVNVLGCILIGGLSYLADSRGMFSAETRLFVFVGLLGGFTTFSTFGNETLNLFRDGQALLAGANIVGNVILCLAGVWAGRAGAFAIWR
ncbi:MAG TPA: fluoride efflux transporter CrcB [Candidatus Krumholzibacteria bacterium]|nr:fluoride efflux transporter CrcB [Candidatus Krumholzibacteria bacterium]